MKYFFSIILLSAFAQVHSQSLIGTWQQIETKTCFQSQLPDSQTATEKELVKDMGESSKTSVANVIRFKNKGSGEEGIFSKGERKGSRLDAFQYKVNGTDLILLDKKSGIMTQHFIIDELTGSSLRIHDAVKDCETRTFSRIK